MRPLVAVAIALLLAPTAAATADVTADEGDHPTIEAAYPNPIHSGDPGEFVVVDVPATVDPTAFALADDGVTVPLPPNASGTRLAVANHGLAANLTDLPVHVAPDLRLANGGDRLTIRWNDTPLQTARRSDTPLQTVHYGSASEGDVVVWNGSHPSWRPLGATDLPVATARNASVRAFVLPDAPDVPVDALEAGDERILLAGYTLTSPRVAEALLDAHARGVTVRVLLEGEPIGGRTRRGAESLDRLQAAGIDVQVLGGPRSRYYYHHAKYAVVDDRALVLTENWKPSGTGGNSSRGWGVETGEQAIVAGLAETFRADADAPDARAWEQVRHGRTFEREVSATASYPSRFDPTSLPADRLDLLVAPDNAHQRLLRTIEEADDRIDVVQPTLGGWNEPLVVALRRAAHRGVDVRILLSDAWYAREENDQLVQRFQSWASEHGHPLQAQTAAPGDRFEKIHAKGAIVDDRVVLGSLNWNEQAATGNREVLLRMEGSAITDYYREVFEADWRGDRPRLPVGIVAALLGTTVLAGLVAARIRFESDGPVAWPGPFET